MEATDVIMDEPLPAPTGPKAMSMFLEQPRVQAAGGAGPQAAPAAAPGDAQLRAISPKLESDPAQPQGQQAPAAEQQQQQQAGMSRLEYETCVAMHSILAKYKEADPFRQPVDVEALGIPDYFEVIKKPMDLKTVRERLRSGHYKSMAEWRAELQLIWDNARKYNGDNHPVTNQALKLQTAMERRLEDAQQVAKANMQAEAKGEPRPRKASKARNTELNALLGSQPASSDSDSLEEAPAAPRASGARLGNGGSSAAVQQRSPEPPKVAVKRERDAAADPSSNRAAKRRPGAGPSAAAGNAQGLDLDSLTALLNTPMARQLGAEEPDDLAFLALWKRLMVRKQQLMHSATDSEPLRSSNQQLRASLATTQDTIRDLRERLTGETQARQAAVAAKDGLEERLAEAEKEVAKLTADVNSQKGFLEQQRLLLEQQQELLRRFAREKQANMAQQAKASGPGPVSAAPHGSH